MADQQPTVGRITHYVLPDGRSKGDHRPAVIVRVWGEDQVKAGTLPAEALGTVQLQVFTDGSNDGDQYAAGIVWKTSVVHDEAGGLGTWHWPERVDAVGPAVTKEA